MGVEAPTNLASTMARRPPRIKKIPTHPPYGDMIKCAVTELKEHGGSSRQAIAKYIKIHYQIDDRLESNLRRALQSGIKSGKLVHTKGVGASGSFKLSEQVLSPNKVIDRSKSVNKLPTVVKVVIKQPAGIPRQTKTSRALKPKPVEPKKTKMTRKMKALRPKKPVAKQSPKKNTRK